MPEWLGKILAEPTASVPDAGRALGIRGKNQSYEAVKRGEIKVLRFGRTLRVPTAWLRAAAVEGRRLNGGADARALAGARLGGSGC